MVGSTSGNLQREQTLTTLGWLQSAAFQVVMMWLWASGRLPYVDAFGGPHLAWNVATVAFVTYWREFHFYWVRTTGVGGGGPWVKRQVLVSLPTTTLRARRCTA
jgi:hypothetical protein